MNVVRHDHAGVAGVSLPPMTSLERAADHLPCGGVECQQGASQDRGRLLVEFADHPTRRLHGLAAVMEFTEFGDDVG